MRESLGGGGVTILIFPIQEEEVGAVIIVGIIRGSVILGIGVAGSTCGIDPDAETKFLLGLLCQSREMLTDFKVGNILTGALELACTLVLQPIHLDECQALILLDIGTTDDLFGHVADTILQWQWSDSEMEQDMS